MSGLDAFIDRARTMLYALIKFAALAVIVSEVMR